MSLESPIEVIYKVVDDCKISTDIYVPPSADISDGIHKYPIVICIHGGAFMLGHSRMISLDQVKDCLDRGWIVVSPNHRLCPQVNILEGPMKDCRDLLRWIYHGNLDAVLSSKPETATFRGDLDRVVAFGTSSGGTLALSLGFGVERPVKAIFDLYGPVSFSDPFWTSILPDVATRLPQFSAEFLKRVYEEHPIPTAGGVSLEGQAHPTGGPDFSDPRQAFALTQIAHGAVMKACYPPEDWDRINPIRNITANFPPTFIVHGQNDTKVPITLSRALFAVLQAHGVECGMAEIPNEDHTFANRMEVGSQTWNLQRQGFDFLQRIIQRIRTE